MIPAYAFESDLIHAVLEALEDGAGDRREIARAAAGFSGEQLDCLLAAIDVVSEVLPDEPFRVRAFAEEPESEATYLRGFWYAVSEGDDAAEETPTETARRPRRKRSVPKDLGVRVVRAADRPATQGPTAPPPAAPAPSPGPLRKTVQGRGRFVTAGKVEGTSGGLSWAPPPDDPRHFRPPAPAPSVPPRAAPEKRAERGAAGPPRRFAPKPRPGGSRPPPKGPRGASGRPPADRRTSGPGGPRRKPAAGPRRGPPRKPGPKPSRR